MPISSAGSAAAPAIAARPRPESWIKVLPPARGGGLYIEPGDFFIDPSRAVDRAVISHGHSDHARAGHRQVLTTVETAAIMQARFGRRAAGSFQTPAIGDSLRVGDVTVTLVPAGHVLGSVQVVVEYRGCRVVISGDYKRRPDPTCPPFEPVPCDLFVTEATFGLPVFRHPPAAAEVGRLLRSLALFPERCHVVGVYSLGKCQRLIALLRQAGYDRPIYLQAALQPLCALYQRFGVALDPLLPLPDGPAAALAGHIVLAPPMAGDALLRALPDPVIAAASGWLGVRQRVRQRGVELPLVISDHADWDELCQTLDEVGAGEIWITHGWEGALLHHAARRGLTARALSLVGFDDGGEAAPDPAEPPAGEPEAAAP